MDAHREQVSLFLVLRICHSIPKGAWEPLDFSKLSYTSVVRYPSDSCDHGSYLAAVVWLPKTHQLEEEGTVFLALDSAGK